MHLNALDQSCQSSVEFYLTKTRDQRPSERAVFIKNETGSKIRLPFLTRAPLGRRGRSKRALRPLFADDDGNVKRDRHLCSCQTSRTTLLTVYMRRSGNKDWEYSQLRLAGDK